jgi:hypothetical protein
VEVVVLERLECRRVLVAAQVVEVGQLLEDLARLIRVGREVLAVPLALLLVVAVEVEQMRLVVTDLVVPVVTVGPVFLRQ